MSSPVTTPATQPPTVRAAHDDPHRSSGRCSPACSTRPEIGAVAAAIAIFIFFFAIAPAFRTLPSFATVLYASSTIGIVAVGVALLMIGGEFDLSAGVSVVTAALFAATLSPTSFAEHVGRGAGRPWSLALAIGFINGYLVVRTRHPQLPDHAVARSSCSAASTSGSPRPITGTVATDQRRPASTGSLAAKARVRLRHPARLHHRQDHRAVVAAVRRHRHLDPAAHQGRQLDLRRRRQRRTRARAVGVPVPKVKIGLFMGVAFLAWFSACTCCSTSPRCSPASASATSSSTSSPRSSAAACSPAATARSSAPRSARSSSA